MLTVKAAVSHGEAVHVVGSVPAFGACAAGARAAGMQRVPQTLTPLAHAMTAHAPYFAPNPGNEVVENSLELVTTPGMCVGAALRPRPARPTFPGRPLTHSELRRYPVWYTPTPIVVVRGTEVDFRLAVFSGGDFSVGGGPFPTATAPSPLRPRPHPVSHPALGGRRRAAQFPRGWCEWAALVPASLAPY